MTRHQTLQSHPYCSEPTQTLAVKMKKSEQGTVAQWVKLLPVMPTFHIGVSVRVGCFASDSASLLIHLGRQQKVARVLAPAAQVASPGGFWLQPDFSLAQTWLLGSSGE